MTGNKIRILSTRPLDPSLTEQAAEQGILLESLSFIETHPLVDEALCGKITGLAGDAAMVAFTSMNAVDAVAGCLGAVAAGAGSQESADAARAGGQKENIAKGGIATSWKIFCIGSATQEHVRENFGQGSIAGTADSASALAAVIAGHSDIKEIVFFCGDQRRDELPKKLWDSGVRVKEYVVYHTRSTPHTISKDYDGVVFFSPSAVNSFFSINTLPAATVLFAIGHTTADAIREWCINPVTVSDSPGKTALLRQVIDHFRPAASNG
jgi:uroporphyrinogen-III synthase